MAKTRELTSKEKENIMRRFYKERDRFTRRLPSSNTLLLIIILLALII